MPRRQKTRVLFSITQFVRSWSHTVVVKHNVGLKPPKQQATPPQPQSRLPTQKRKAETAAGALPAQITSTQTFTLYHSIFLLIIKKNN